ncbi:Trafficking kinesin-binding protein 1 [Eufriesea mexicana]|nr:Trafficking kinesin-binding protein 1 [Eufriesea mexicana]
MKEGEAISFVATASKLAAVEDAAPKGPEASIRSKVSPTARATLQALRSSRNRISAPLAPSPVTTKDVETITERNESIRLELRIMYVGSGESSRPSGPARIKKNLEKKERILNRWRNEVCSGADLPEVEIISLLEEQMPRYRLRADTLTQFQGKYK